ncbi:uncharacterized protein LOC111865470 isoform X1 [Cryptotermes secundus]|uniref:uncharacterized protein LOC111865470 isoform X1 n=1 Tax=Cryptotermes secundus TaxID=105785 RepID=UPI000CD7C5C0|nr:uncharacterized protein LOC111865470 isoform X1 [Cryptotermes secundus]
MGNANAEIKHPSRSVTFGPDPRDNVAAVMRAKFGRDIPRTSVTVVQPYFTRAPFLFKDVETTHENNGRWYQWFLFLLYLKQRTNVTRYVITKLPATWSMTKRWGLSSRLCSATLTVGVGVTGQSSLLNVTSGRTCVSLTLVPRRDDSVVCAPVVSVRRAHCLRLLKGETTLHAGVLHVGSQLHEMLHRGSAASLQQHSESVNLEDYGFTTRLKIPKLRIEGLYTVNGRILVLPLTGHGDAWLEPEDLNVMAHVEVSMRVVDDIKFFKPEGVHVNFTIGSLRLRLDNLFNGLKALEERTNDYININWRPVVESLKPILSRIVAGFLSGILTNVFENIPAKYFIGDLS